MVYEKGGLSIFKNFIFIGPKVVVLSFNVLTNIDLGFVLFLIACRNIQKQLSQQSICN